MSFCQEPLLSWQNCNLWSLVIFSAQAFIVDLAILLNIQSLLEMPQPQMPASQSGGLGRVSD